MHVCQLSHGNAQHQLWKSKMLCCKISKVMEEGFHNFSFQKWWQCVRIRFVRGECCAMKFQSDVWGFNNSSSKADSNAQESTLKEEDVVLWSSKVILGGSYTLLSKLMAMRKSWKVTMLCCEISKWCWGDLILSSESWWQCASSERRGCCVVRVFKRWGRSLLFS